MSVYLSPELKTGAVAGMLWGLCVMLEGNYEVAFSTVIAKVYASHPGILPFVWLMLTLGVVIVGGVTDLVIGVIFIKTRGYIPGHSIFVEAALLWVALWMPAALLSYLWRISYSPR